MSHTNWKMGPLPFEEWMLTAWILNELDEADSARVQAWVEQSQSNHNYVETLRSTLGVVESNLKQHSFQLAREQSDELKTGVMKAIELNESQNGYGGDSSPFTSSLISNKNTKLFDQRPSNVPWFRRRSMIAAYVAAACIPIGLLASNSLRFGERSDRSSRTESTRISNDTALTNELGLAETEQEKRLAAQGQLLRGGTGAELIQNENRLASESAKEVLNQNSEVSISSLVVSESNHRSIPFQDGSGAAENMISESAEESRGEAPFGRSSETKNEVQKLWNETIANNWPTQSGEIAQSSADSLNDFSLSQSSANLTESSGTIPESLADPNVALRTTTLPEGLPGAYGVVPNTSPGSTMSSGLPGIMTSDSGRGGRGIQLKEEAFTLGKETSALGVNQSLESRLNDGLKRYQASMDGLAEVEYKSRGRIPAELEKNFKRPLVLRELDLPRSPAGDRFDSIVENSFVPAKEHPVTTMSIDVDTASYSKIRQLIQQSQSVPSPSMVRIEEMVNYFQYQYPSPANDLPFSADLSLGDCPWNSSHKLLRVGIQAKKLLSAERPRSNLVFLVDVSGSMDEPNKLPLVQRSLSMLTNQLREEDRVAIVVYAGAAGCVLNSTSGQNRNLIIDAVNNLKAGGSTNGGQGIQLAYQIAKENFVQGGANRVILCTDGDFNVGVTDTPELVELMRENAKSNIYLTCLGFGNGNYNDSMMEKISKDGNGFYGMVDNDAEARKLMVQQLSGTLVTVAKDVKIQLDFNPEFVRSYRMIGYEDRQLANADFNNDKKDAGDIGAGHSVTAFYEIVPSGLLEPALTRTEDQSKYQPTQPNISNEPRTIAVPEWLTLKIRSKQPEANESTLQEFTLSDETVTARLKSAFDHDFRWATSVVEFGLLMRQSKFAPNANWDKMIQRASQSCGDDPYRLECVELMRTVKNRSTVSAGE